jgi:proteic killer suppression protein
VGRIADQATQDIYDGKPTGPARRALPQDLWPGAQRKLDLVLAASILKALASPPNNRLKKLDGDLAGQWSIRINDQYRIVFHWTDELRAHHVRICDYH